MTKRSANILLGIILVFVGIFMAYSASQARGGRSGELGPSFFPTIAAISLSVLGAFTVIHQALKGEKTKMRFFSRKFPIIIGSLAAYTILLRFLGYIICGMLIVAVIMLLMKTEPLRKTWIPIILVMALAPIIVYFIFANFLLVPLPVFFY
jgi:hypothetical protein